MGGGREDIIGGIRRALRRGPLGAAAQDGLRDRLVAPQRNLVPARAAGLDHAGQVELFLAMAAEADTTIARVATLDGVPDAVAEYLAAGNLPSELTLAPDPALDALPWARRPLLRLHRGKAGPAVEVSLTPAFAGIAETGTLMLVSGRKTPSTLNFLPDTHIVVLRRSQVLATYEEGWTRLRERQAALGEPALPRTVNFITGPSRTGDIEQRMQLGAHGPRRLHILLVEEPAVPAPSAGRPPGAVGA